MASSNGPPRGRPGGGLTGRWHRGGMARTGSPRSCRPRASKRHQSRLVRHCAGTHLADGLDFPLAALPRCPCGGIELAVVLAFGLLVIVVVEAQPTSQPTSYDFRRRWGI